MNQPPNIYYSIFENVINSIMNWNKISNQIHIILKSGNCVTETGHIFSEILRTDFVGPPSIQDAIMNSSNIFIVNEIES